MTLFKKGDLVKCIDSTFTTLGPKRLKKGKEYSLLGVLNLTGGSLLCVCDEARHSTYWSSSRFELVQTEALVKEPSEDIYNDLI